MQLFEDEEGPRGSGGLTVNKQYASRFEHNKKREELHRLKEKYPEQAARLERQDEGLIPDEKESRILEVLQKIRAKDPAVFDPTVKFFPDSEGEEQEDHAKGRKQKSDKPMLLKDYTYKQAMEGVPEQDSTDEEAPHTYKDEQHDAKSAFLQAVAEVDGDEELDFAARKPVARPEAGGDAGGQAEAGEDRIKGLLDGYFGADETLEDEGDRFLKRYILSKGWVDREGGEASSSGDEAGTGPDYEEEEEYLQQAERYEHKYNFRFEYPGSETLVTHPRQIEGTVRKEDDRRKRRRAEKAARLAAQEEERAAEMRRLKNLKKEEVNARLREIQAVAGGTAPPAELLQALADDEFDPDEYDRQMAAAYGEDFYEAEEEDPEALEAEYEKQLEALAFGSGTDDDDAGGSDQRPTSATTYKGVDAQSFGLSSSEILAMADKELNQVVGLKLLAPYRDEHRKVRPNYGAVNALKQQVAAQAGAKRKRGSSGHGEKGPVWRHGDVREGASEGMPKARFSPSSQSAASAEELRAATYAAPRVHRPDKAGMSSSLLPPRKKKKKAEREGAPTPASKYAGLPKAHQKNLRRHEKRAKARGKARGVAAA
ncbi:Protein kri1 [Auxenochlorella protothecoides]|uniref:Protein kri1 n=1 Tax=Auxenochlorella protothecoides TaxID=3075 RepID=A0A087SDG5_AUXPR|nr:Protein kri1 [Auxenochlorella protothecoides]KFM23769.1 Protein kri1 [Auxenochlorella protothecoides]